MNQRIDLDALIKDIMKHTAHWPTGFLNPKPGIDMAMDRVRTGQPPFYRVEQKQERAYEYLISEDSQAVR